MLFEEYFFYFNSQNLGILWRPYTFKRVVLHYENIKGMYDYVYISLGSWEVLNFFRHGVLIERKYICHFFWMCGMFIHDMCLKKYNKNSRWQKFNFSFLYLHSVFFFHGVFVCKVFFRANKILSFFRSVWT